MDKLNLTRLKELTVEVSLTLWNEPPALRPTSDAGGAGGLLCLKPELPTIIVPDLHNRYVLLEKLLRSSLEEGKSVQQALADGEVQVVLLGDLIHTENPTLWHRSAEEFRKRYYTSKVMDYEMQESFKTIQMVLELKSMYSDVFHILKGNHENILSSNQGGNRALSKYALESKMVKAWLGVSGGQAWMKKYAELEAHLPLVAIGKGFIASHAQPKRAFTRSEIIEGLAVEEVVFGLTWTRPSQAEEGAITAMKKELLGSEDGYWIAGHTAIHNKLDLREEGLVLFHDPAALQVIRVDPGQALDLDQNVDKALIRFPE